MSTLKKVTNDFDKQIATTYEFISNINQLNEIPSKIKQLQETLAKTKKLKKINYINIPQINIQSTVIDNIYEIAFIKILTAWESFLEDSFLNYLCGHYVKNQKPKKIVNRLTIDQAYDLIKGKGNYPDWTNISEIRHFSDLFFIANNPYKIPLSSLETYYNEMKSIRNCIAHISKNSKQKFINLIINKSCSPTFTPG